MQEMNTQYGSYKPNALKQSVIGLTRTLPNNWFGKRLGFTLRKLVHGKNRLPIDTDVFGLNLRLHGYDNKCEKRVVCLPQMFDPEERHVLETAARAKGKDFNFIDLGANVGLYSLFMASLKLPNTKIIAIEADPYIYQRLRFNIDNNNLDIQAFNMAVSDTDGTITLNINPKNRGENSIIHAQGDGEKIDVKCQTLLSIMDTQNMKQADAIKLDLEGAEETVLTSFFAHAPKSRLPKLILIENAPERWESDIYALIEQQGYNLHFANKSNRVYTLKK
ncbi:MAG: FkbM family methyltransferase [Micavibrio sp.]|nr:FkbM family methyltransferase [Micavibrio sp.]|tara:strand:- start:252 stop:1082 length:831 start_codon:yes stop_codon:yes gene_type:complete